MELWAIKKAHRKRHLQPRLTRSQESTWWKEKNQVALWATHTHKYTHTQNQKKMELSLLKYSFWPWIENVNSKMSLDPELKINSENQKIKNHLVWKLKIQLSEFNKAKAQAGFLNPPPTQKKRQEKQERKKQGKGGKKKKKGKKEGRRK